MAAVLSYQVTTNGIGFKMQERLLFTTVEIPTTSWQAWPTVLSRQIMTSRIGSKRQVRPLLMMARCLKKHPGSMAHSFERSRRAGLAKKGKRAHSIHDGKA
jgi:hypothetical protein